MSTRIWKRGSIIGLLLSVIFGTAIAHAQKKAVAPPDLPASPNFSPGILVDGTLYASGQIGMDKERKIPADFDAEVKAALDNAGRVLQAAGMEFSDVVSVQVYLTDMSLFQKMNAVYVTYFKDQPRPARTTVGVAKLALPDAHIEITITANKAGVQLTH